MEDDPDYEIWLTLGNRLLLIRECYDPSGSDSLAPGRQGGSYRSWSLKISPEAHTTEKKFTGF